MCDSTKPLPEQMVTLRDRSFTCTSNHTKQNPYGRENWTILLINNIHQVNTTNSGRMNAQTQPTIQTLLHKKNWETIHSAYHILLEVPYQIEVPPWINLHRFSLTKPHTLKQCPKAQCFYWEEDGIQISISNAFTSLKFDYLNNIRSPSQWLFRGLVINNFTPIKHNNDSRCSDIALHQIVIWHNVLTAKPMDVAHSFRNFSNRKPKFYMSCASAFIPQCHGHIYYPTWECIQFIMKHIVCKQSYHATIVHQKEKLAT